MNKYHYYNTVDNRDYYITINSGANTGLFINTFCYYQIFIILKILRSPFVINYINK